MFRPQNYDYFRSWQPCFRSGWQYSLRRKAQFFSLLAVLATRFSKNGGYKHFVCSACPFHDISKAMTFLPNKRVLRIASYFLYVGWQ